MSKAWKRNKENKVIETQTVHPSKHLWRISFFLLLYRSFLIFFLHNKTQTEIKILRYFISYQKIYIRISKEFQNVTVCSYTYRVKIGVIPTTIIHQSYIYSIYSLLYFAHLYSNVVLSNNKKTEKLMQYQFISIFLIYLKMILISR